MTIALGKSSKEEKTLFDTMDDWLRREGRDGYTGNSRLSLYKANGDKLCLEMDERE